MLLYLQIIKFNFLRYLVYPLEIISSVLKRFGEVFLLIIFWSVYSQSSGINLSSYNLISYFLIALGVNDIVMAKWGQFGSLIRHQIKDGTLSNEIIKPVNILLLLYAKSLGKSGIKIIFAIIYIIAGLAISSTTNPINYLLFFLLLINAWAIGFAYNILEGSVAFYSPESGNISNTIQNTISLLTGSMIPLSFFPTVAQKNNIKEDKFSQIHQYNEATLADRLGTN